MNVFLEPFRIQMVGKNDVYFEVNQVLFGCKNVNLVDITEEAKSRFLNGKNFTIPRGTVMNELCKDDPVPNTKKLIYVHFTVQGRKFCKVYDEMILIYAEDIKLDFNTYFHAEWTVQINIQDSKTEIETFCMFLKKIYFREKFVNLANKLQDTIQQTSLS